MLTAGIVAGLFLVLSFVDVPMLEGLTSQKYISLE
jgi:hypothetical protein